MQGLKLVASLVLSSTFAEASRNGWVSHKNSAGRREASKTVTVTICAEDGNRPPSTTGTATGTVGPTTASQTSTATSSHCFPTFTLMVANSYTPADSASVSVVEGPQSGPYHLGIAQTQYVVAVFVLDDRTGTLYHKPNGSANVVANVDPATNPSLFKLDPPAQVDTLARCAIRSNDSALVCQAAGKTSYGYSNDFVNLYPPDAVTGIQLDLIASDVGCTYVDPTSDYTVAPPGPRSTTQPVDDPNDHCYPFFQMSFANSGTAWDEQYCIMTQNIDSRLYSCRPTTDQETATAFMLDDTNGQLYFDTEGYTVTLVANYDPKTTPSLFSGSPLYVANARQSTLFHCSIDTGYLECSAGAPPHSFHIYNDTLVANNGDNRGAAVALVIAEEGCSYVKPSSPTTAPQSEAAVV
jgi:hypothetical protein